jgi:hypothetical protein
MTLVGINQKVLETPRPKAANGKAKRDGERDFRGEKRSNATHASTTDPDARLFRKGQR